MSWGVALRNAVGLGLGGIPSLLNAPPYAKLAFNFLSGELDPRITFTRASNATLIGSDGTLQYAPHNLLTYSEQFDNAAWVKSNTTVNANNVVAPDGTTTADELVEDTATSTHNISASTAFAGNSQTVLSVYLKAGERTSAIVRLRDAANNANLVQAVFDLSNGTAGTATNGGTGSGALATITSVGNGWYRCVVSGNLNTTGNAQANIRIQFGGNDSYTGNGTSGIYVWGAQLNVGALQPYYSTTVKNLLGYSQEFDNAAWSKVASSIATNLLTYSEQIDNAAWTKAQSTITSNSVVAPDGTTTADKLVETAVANEHTALQQTNSTAGVTFTLSLYAKKAERDYVVVSFGSGFTGTPTRAWFDLTNGTVGTLVNSPTASIVSVGNGWYRCSISKTATVSGSSGNCLINVATGDNVLSYTGDGVSGLYVWGAQLVQSGAAETYQRTEATIRPIGYTAPDGSLTADKLVADISTGPHYITPSPALSLVVGQVLTYSVYAKAAERTFLQLILTGVGAGPTNLIAGFDLVAGVAGTPSAGSTSSIVAVGNGWYRCGITTPIATAGTPTQQIRVAQNSSSTPSSYTGDGTSGIYIWGAQFSDSASLDPYFYNPAAAPSNTAYYGPRLDYDPVTLAPEGLLIEEQRTNLILSSQNISLATWGSSGNITANVNSGVSPDGTQNATAVMETTTNGTHTIGQTVTVVANTNYAASIYLKANGRDQAIVYYGMTGTPFTRIGVLVNLSTGSFVNSDVGTPSSVTVRSLTPVGNDWYRVVIAGIAETTVTDGLLEVRFYNGTTSNYAGDSTKGMFVWGGQVEAGAFATSYIPTTTTALTRAADVASVTGANFSSWYNQTEGTLVTTTLAINQTFPPNRYVSTMDDGTTSNIIGAYIATDLNAASFVVNGGVAVYQEIITTVSNTSPNSIAVTYKANDFMSAANGVLGIPDTSGAIPVVNKITFGNRSDGARPLNGHIRSFKYYPTRLSNGQLQTLTK